MTEPKSSNPRGMSSTRLQECGDDQPLTKLEQKERMSSKMTNLLLNRVKGLTGDIKRLRDHLQKDPHSQLPDLPWSNQCKRSVGNRRPRQSNNKSKVAASSPSKGTKSKSIRKTEQNSPVKETFAKAAENAKQVSSLEGALMTPKESKRDAELELNKITEGHVSNSWFLSEPLLN